MRLDKNILKKAAVYLGIVLFFLILAYSTVPQVLSGKIVNQGDIIGYNSMAKETISFKGANPEDVPRWTGSMFGGMPNTSFNASSNGDLTSNIYWKLLAGKWRATWRLV